MTMNAFDQKYAEHALALHDTVMRLDSKDGAEIRIWHLLRSLIEFCDAQSPRLDLDQILASVREDYRADT
jgi:hypothetical protein